jgi:hypothetical protein
VVNYSSLLCASWLICLAYLPTILQEWRNIASL